MDHNSKGIDNQISVLEYCCLPSSLANEVRCFFVPTQYICLLLQWANKIDLIVMHMLHIGMPYFLTSLLRCISLFWLWVDKKFTPVTIEINSLKDLFWRG